jgi:hypothetical protein
VFTRRFPISDVDPEERYLRIESARKRLNGCCGGLLETRQDSNEDTSEGIVITHRSISEFLSSRIQRARMQHYLIGFNSVDAISRLTLAELCSREPGNIENKSYFDKLALVLVYLRSMAKLDGHPYSFLVSLALAWQRHQGQGYYDSVGSYIVAPVDCRNTALIDVVPTSDIPRGYEIRQTLRHPIYAATLLGSYEYVLWELGRNPGAIHLFTPHRLLNCILASPEIYLEGTRDLIDCLHSNHGMHPETTSNLFSTFFYPDPSNPEAERFSGFGDGNTEVSLWHHILLRCYRLWLYPSAWRYKTSVLFGEIVEKSLEYGADPYFYICVTNPPLDHRIKLVVRVRGVVQEQKLVFKGFPKRVMAENECENMSLVDLVERWGFKNKTRVLELIKKNMLMLEGADDQIKGTILPEKEEAGEKPLATVGMDDSATLDDVRALPSESISDGSEICIDTDPEGDLLTGVWGSGSPNLFGFSAAISIGTLVLGERHISTREFLIFEANRT